MALITVERLLGATLRFLRDGQGVVLGNVIVGFAVHDGIDVFWNCGRWDNQCQRRYGSSDSGQGMG
ncbi:MAG: hypothetical protein ACKPKO_24665, partial [Candidatus Fonsibacter sp.]